MDFPKWKSEKNFDYPKTFKKSPWNFFLKNSKIQKKFWKFLKNFSPFFFHQMGSHHFCAPFWVQFSSTGKSGVYSKFGRRPQNAWKRVERLVLAKF